MFHVEHDWVDGVVCLFACIGGSCFTATPHHFALIQVEFPGVEFCSRYAKRKGVFASTLQTALRCESNRGLDLESAK